MSVKLIYDVPRSEFRYLQQLGGFCYCRRRDYGSSQFSLKCNLNSAKTLIDISPKSLESKPTKENPIVVNVNFGLVSVDTTIHQDFLVYSSKVKPIHSLTIEPKDQSIIFDNAFRAALPVQHFLPELLPRECQSPNEGRKKLKFRIYFEPELAYMNYADSIHIWVDGDVPIRIDCQGIAEGPSVCFSENLLNFGGQYYGDEGKMKFKMNNKSGTDAKFQFENDNTRSVFKICPTSGIVPGNSELTVEVTFQAPKPQTYYKRIICLIHHQHTQYVDVIGICIPRPFFSISEIDFGLSTGDTQFLPIPTESNIEYFQSSGYWGIEFDKEAIDFGFRDLGLAPEEPIVLTVTNLLPYDVVIEWIVDPTRIFSISPQTSVIQAGQLVPFDLSFNPSFPETFYYGELECYIYPTGYLWPEEQGGAPWIVSRKPISPVNSEKVEEADTVEAQKPANSVPGSRVPTPPLIVLKEGPLASKIPSDEEILGEAFSRITITDMEKKTDESNHPSKSRSNTHPSAPRHHGGPKHKDAKKHSEHKDKKPSRKKTAVSLNKQAAGESHKEVDSSESKSETAAGTLGITAPLNTPPTEDPELIIIKHSENSDIQLSASKAVSKVLSRRYPPPQKSEQAVPTEAGDIGPKSQIEFPLNLILKNYGSICQESRQVDPVDVQSILDNILGINVIRESEPEVENEITQKDRKSLSEQVFVNEEEEDENGEEMNKEVAPTRSMPNELALPLCMTLKLTGHTTVKFSPVTRFKVPSKITMPPTWPKQETSRTMILKNDNDLPVHFNIMQSEEENNPFTLKPTKGMIPGKFHQIILVNMKSDVLDSTTPANCQTATVLLNFHDSNTVAMRGFCCLPTMEIVLCYNSILCDFNLVFPETLLGRVVDTEMELRNPTRFHYKFALVGPKSASAIIKDEEAYDISSIFNPIPASGTVSPYGVIKVKWTFSPSEIKEYFSIWKINFLCMRNKYDDLSSCPAYSANIPLIGLARDCKLEAIPNKTYFEFVELFTLKEEVIQVRNTCNTPVKVTLKLVHDVWLQYFPKQLARIKPKKFVLNGLESIDLKIMVRPDTVKIQDFTVEYLLEPITTDSDVQVQSTETIKSLVNMQVFNQFHKLCQFSFIGDHASIKVTDITMIARHPIWDAGQAWSMFSLTKFNELLTPMKTCLKEETLNGLPPKIPSVTFRFPPAPLNAESAIFTILLTNTGTLQAQWKVYTEPPAQLPPYFQTKNLKPSYDGNIREDNKFLASVWAQRMIEKYKKKVAIPTTTMSTTPTPSTMKATGCVSIKPFRDFKLFKVSPKNGTMDLGMDNLISFRYSYKEIGNHEITFLLRVYPSVFIWIKLRGTTLEPATPFIQHMHKDECTLVPVALSDLDPPIQLFWMFNGGNVEAPYEVDTKPFAEAQNENFGHPVWDCLNKSGVIPPRSWTPIRVRFSPLEIKDYMIPLNVSTNGKLHTMITLRGSPLLDPIKLLRPAELCGLEVPDQKISLIDPLVPIILTPSRIAFPHLIPTGQKSNSLVFITNISDTNEISFNWPEVLLEGGGSIKFVPDFGILKPKSEQPCMIIVEGGKVSITFSRLIRCSLIDETARIQYKHDKKSWNTCKLHYMKVEGMSEKEALVKLIKKFGSKPIEPLSFSRIICVSVYISSVLGMLDHNTAKEQERIIAVPRCKPLVTDPTSEIGNKLLNISPFTRELSKELLSNVVWDLITLELEPITIEKPHKPKASKTKSLTAPYSLSSTSIGLSGSKGRSRLRSIWPENYVDGQHAGVGARAPIYFDYKLVEENKKHPHFHDLESPTRTTASDDTVNELILPGTGTQDVISNVLMNLMQEYSTEFEPGNNLPHPLNPVVPKEIINLQKYPYYYTM